MRMKALTDSNICMIMSNLCNFDAGNIWYNSLESKKKKINLATIGSRKMEKVKKEKVKKVPQRKQSFGVYMKRYWQLYVLLALPLLSILL